MVRRFLNGDWQGRIGMRLGATGKCCSGANAGDGIGVGVEALTPIDREAWDPSKH